MTADPSALARLHARAFVAPRPWTAAEFAALLAMPGCFLIERADAFLLGRAAADEAELLTLAVDPGARRRGLGRALVAAFTERAAAAGARHGWLEVAAGNEGARALYATTGWTEAGRRRGYFMSPGGGREDAIVMTCAILPPDGP
jgi:ribosomal-protein-alanine N-acetyltransferase